MWASYLKAQNKGKIISNPCFGAEYNEEENISATQYMLKFVELFPKDIKYFMKNFYFNIGKYFSTKKN